MKFFDVILILIVIVAVIFLVIELIPEDIPDSPDVALEFGNFTSEVTYTERSDQYGNPLSASYNYHVYCNLNDNYTDKNFTVHIKAYDSQWNLLDNISENVSLTSLDNNYEDSDRVIVFNHFTDELIDFKYLVFEVYENNTRLYHNETVEFDLDNIDYQSRISYYGGEVW